MPDSVRDDVSAYDWREELARQERDIMWLSRKTGIHYRLAYRIFHGERPATPAQLEAIWSALGLGSR
jgi:hypothetical protein